MRKIFSHMKRKKALIYISLLIGVVALIVFNPAQIFTIIALRVLGHYQSPRTESSETLKNYVKDHSLAYDKLYAVTDFNSFKELNDNGISKVPTVQIFDGDKRLLKMAEENDCTWVLTNYFKQHSSDMISSDTNTYRFVMERLLLIDDKVSQDTFDFYIISYWAKYLPKLSQRLFAQTNSMKERMSENICLMYVSLDQQDGWNME